MRSCASLSAVRPFASWERRMTVATSAPIVNDGPVERRAGVLSAHRPSLVPRTRRTDSVLYGCLGRIGRAMLAAITNPNTPGRSPIHNQSREQQG